LLEIKRLPSFSLFENNKQEGNIYSSRCKNEIRNKFMNLVLLIFNFFYMFRLLWFS